MATATKTVKKAVKKAKKTVKKAVTTAKAKAGKRVFFFGDGKAEGGRGDKLLLGGKGANLADMTVSGFPVPPGFTITTETCKQYNDLGQKLPEGLMDEVGKALKKVEKSTGKKFGDNKDPLLVSVRSGAFVSMPGMMDTVLNLGLNDVAVEAMAEATGNPKFAYDSYRRLIDMFGDVVMGAEHEHFEHELVAVKKAAGVENDNELTADQLKEVVARYKKVYRKEVGKPFPQDPMKQLEAAIRAVFGSWMTDRAIKYRQINDITGLAGTAVNVQTMVFGNMGDDCATGVAFTRDPNTGENSFYGEYLINAQGEDVVAGIRTPIWITQMKKTHPKWHKALMDT
ncbi:MAG: PEP/pyruvate-binding domain-containing protein, partial [Planctomycetota bacterium]